MVKDKKKYSILLVEDNQGDFILIEEYLKEQIRDPQITHVKNFKDAKALLLQDKIEYDVILLDLSLPDKSGESLIAEINILFPVCPVIILTGYTDIEFSIKSLSLGIADYLLKEDITATSLYKSIIYNIERNRTNIKLEESEKRYSNLFHLSPQPMWVYDPETLMFIQVNKAAIDHYGYSEKEFLAMSIMDISLEEEIQLLKKFINKQEDQGNVINGRFRHHKKSKETIDVEIYSNSIMINDKMYSSVIAIDVSEKLQFENKITLAIIKTQEDERYEIGSELHDNVCQLLSTSLMSLGMMKKSLSSEIITPYNQCKEYIRLAADEIRNLSHRLAPVFFQDSTLEGTFQLLLTTFNMEKKYEITFQMDNAVEKYSFNEELLLNLYRILQEQLRNISKYAKATQLEVNLLIENNNLKMKVSDNGIGFNPVTTKRGIGLANMKRRAELFAGNFEINTSPGAGCKIIISIPLKEMNDYPVFDKKILLPNIISSNNS